MVNFVYLFYTIVKRFYLSKLLSVTSTNKTTKAEEGIPTSDFRLPTSDFRLPTSDFRLQTSDFRLQTSDFRLQNLKHRSSTRRTQNMDRGPWTTPNFQKEIGPVNFKWKFTGEFWEWKTDSYLLHTSLRVCLVKAGCFGIVPGINGKTTNSFWDTEGLVHFYPQYFHSYTSKLQFDQEDTPPPSPGLSYSIVNKNKPIYFINEVYPTSTNL